ncbi:MAG: efflux RND transporter periplasmic adaptor subunit [Acidobacteriota bacterium]
MTPKWRNRLIVLAVVAASVLVLRFTVFAPKPVPVSAYRVAAGRVEDTVANSKSGTVKVRRRAKLSPEIGGRVTYLGAIEGQRVRGGDVLLRIDDSELRAALMLSERAAQAARATQQEACLVADLARRELDRNQALRQQGIISDSVIDQLSNGWEAAEARCEASRAEVRRADAAVDVARANLAKTELRAPFDGVVVEIGTQLGEWVTPSPPALPVPPVIDMLDDRGIYVEAPMDETDSAKLRPGLPVRISLDSHPGKSFPGRLTRVAPFVRDFEGQNRTVDVEAEFEDVQFARTLLPGTSADVEVILQARDNVLRIPAHALTEGDRVLVIDKDRLAARKVEPGIRNWEFVEVRGGLKAGDRVAVSLDRVEVKEGALVRVSEEVTR